MWLTRIIDKLAELLVAPSGRMDVTRVLIPAALSGLLVVDPANRGRTILIAAAATLACVNFIFVAAHPSSGLPGSRSATADALRFGNLFLLLAVGVFAIVPPPAAILLMVLAVDSLIRRFLYYGTAIALFIALLLLWFIHSPYAASLGPYDRLWIFTLLCVAAAHRTIVTVQAVRRRTALAAGQELYAHEAEQLERLVAITEDVLVHHDVQASLGSIALGVRDVFGFKHVSIVTADGETGALRRRVALGVPEDELQAHLDAVVDLKSVLPYLSGRYEVLHNCYYAPAEASKDGVERVSTDAWHERDALLFVLPDEEDNMVGYMTVDGPLDGKVPRRHTLRSMQIFVNLVGLALATTASRAAQIERNRILEEAGRLQQEFLSMVSHEVRSPLTAIRGVAQMLRAHGAQMSSLRRGELLDTLRSASTQLNRIFEDLLLISQMDAGQLRLHPTPISPRTIVEDAVRQLLLEHPGRAVTLIAPPNLPAIYADEGRTTQVVTNILSNAAKYSNDRSIITATIDLEDDAIRISITNEGIGIAPEDQPKLFTRFGSLSDSSASTGLGLYISKQLVDAMNGRIGCQSVPNEHTTFWFSLPLSGRTSHIPSPPATSPLGEPLNS